MQYPKNQVFPPLATAQPFDPVDDLATDFRRRGYAFLPGLLDRRNVLQVRHELLEIASGAGWLDPSTPVDEGRSGPQAFGENSEPDSYFPHYRRVQATESFHALGHDNALIDTISTIAGEPVFSLPLKMARYTFPTRLTGGSATPHHQDYFFIQGSSDLLIGWVSLGDLVGAGSGRLAVLAGSHRLGLWGADWFDELDANVDVGWRTGDIRAGDVLIFHGLTVHMSEPNDRDTLRLSVDYRFQPVADPVAPPSLQPHYDIAPWDDLYEGWTGKAPRHYWKELDLTVRPRVDEISELRGACRPRLVAA